MTLKSVRAAIARVSLRVRLFVASVLDRGLDSLLADLNRLNGRLDRRIRNLQDRQLMNRQEVARSYSREEAVRNAERDTRGRIYDDTDALISEEGRARRIRRRVSDLLS